MTCHAQKSRRHSGLLLGLALVAASCLLGACAAQVTAGRTASATLDGQPPLVIAHRGASGYLPEETLEAYARAIELGADAIEMDLVSTRDGVLVTRHDANLAISTDVASRPEFAARRKTVQIGRQQQTGWFSHDFTLAELKTLRAISTDAGRPQQFNGLYPVPTFQEVVDLARAASTRGRSVAIYVETKDPAWFRSLGLPLEDKLAAIIQAQGWSSATAPVFVQSFDADSLKRMRAMGLKVRMVQLLGGASSVAPADLSAIGTYADGIGPAKRLLASAPAMVGNAHQAGLFVHPYTFGQPDDDVQGAFRLGVDGVFTDFADLAVAARTGYLKELAEPGKAR